MTSSVCTLSSLACSKLSASTSLPKTNCWLNSGSMKCTQ
jgi:hypothetical protein